MLNDDLIFSITILVQSFLLVMIVSRIGFKPVPSLAMAYVVVSEIIFYLVRCGAVDYPFLAAFSVGGTTHFFQETLLVYCLLFGILLLPYIDVLFSHERNSSSEGYFDFKVGNVSLLSNLSLVILVVFMLLTALVLRWETVWENNVYLAMTSPSAALEDVSFAVLLSLFPIVGVWSAVLCGLNLVRGSRFRSICFAIISAMFSIHSLAAHQRTAILEPLALLSTLLLVGRGRYRYAILASGAYAILALVSALVGRGMGRHGLIAIFDPIDYSGSRNTIEIFFMIVTNLCEGIFVVAEGFQHSPNFPADYKILSFLPTPSFIDGFDVIRDAYQYRLGKYVPMSGYSEAYFFGAVYQAILAFLLFLSVALYRIASTKSRIAALGSGFLIALAIVTLSAYPIRNGLKAIWVANILNISVLLLGIVNKKKTANKIRKNFEKGMEVRSA